MSTGGGTGGDAGQGVSANLMLEWCPLHLDAGSRATWFHQLTRAVTQRMHIFDAVGLGVRTSDKAGDRDTIMPFAVLERFPLLLASIHWTTHTLTVLRSSHRHVPPQIRQPAAEELSLPPPAEFRPPSAPREGRGRPLSAISSDKIQGGKRLRPARREGHGRPASAFPSDKYHGVRRLRPTVKEGFGRPTTGSGRDSPTGVAGLSVADTVRPLPSPSPAGTGRRSELSDDDGDGNGDGDDGCYNGSDGHGHHAEFHLAPRPVSASDSFRGGSAHNAPAGAGDSDGDDGDRHRDEEEEEEENDEEQEGDDCDNDEEEGEGDDDDDDSGEDVDLHALARYRASNTGRERDLPSSLDRPETSTGGARGGGSARGGVNWNPRTFGLGPL